MVEPLSEVFTQNQVTNDNRWHGVIYRHLYTCSRVKTIKFVNVEQSYFHTIQQSTASKKNLINSILQKLKFYFFLIIIKQMAKDHTI